MELILEIGNFVKDVAKAVNIYLDKLEHSGFSGVEPFLTDKIRSSTKTIIEDTELSTLLNSSVSLGRSATGSKLSFGTAFEIFGNLWETHFHLGEAYKIFMDFRLDPSREGSRTSSGVSLSSTYLKSLNE